MRKILIPLFLSTVIGVTGCGSSTAPTSSPTDQPAGQTAEQKSGTEQKLAAELKLFSWGEYFPDEVLEDFKKEFGVKVIYDKFSSNAELLTKLKSGAVRYDLVVPIDYMVDRMIKQDMIQELDMNNIPNFANIEETFQQRWFDPGNKFSVPYLYGSIGLAYDKTKTDNPKGFEDLWNPKYKGHVVLSDAAREAVGIALQKVGYSINDTDPGHLEEAKKALIEVMPNVLAFTNEPADLLASGDAWIAAAYSGATASAMKTNPNLTYIMPEEGGVLWLDNLVIPKDAENKYTAEVFINYILRPEVSKTITDNYPFSNPNKAAIALMSDEEKKNVASYPPQESLKKAEWFTDLGPELIDVQEVWKQVRGQ